MRREVYESVRANRELHQYLRMHPLWYRKLGRDPEKVAEMVRESKFYFGRTLSQRVDQIHRNMNTAMMMVEMMRQVNEN
ncbi:YlbE-like family protein [Salipaludibacillus sp. HK11]|uniref:YlbE-like family protein n=1 Tax=Salipaludibacillus sp. HK11 TaxID=3394320 RepID=UPI0039FC6D6E